MDKEKWFSKTVEETEKNLKTNIETGLSLAEVKKRQEENGFNELKQPKKKSLFVKSSIFNRNHCICIIIW